jgi:hypothetical protein
MAANFAFWKDLEAQFRALPDPRGQMRALLSDGQWEICDGPQTEAERRRLHSKFRTLARLAGINSGVPKNANAFNGWLNLVSEESPNFHVLHGHSQENGIEISHDGGYVENLALACAAYCVERAVLAFELDAAAIDDGAPPGLRRDRYHFCSWLYDHPHEPIADPKAELDCGKARVWRGYNFLVDRYVRLGMASWANRHELLNQAVGGLSYDLAVLQANWLMDQGLRGTDAIQAFDDESSKLVEQVASSWRGSCEQLAVSFADDPEKVKDLARPFELVRKDLRSILQGLSATNVPQKSESTYAGYVKASAQTWKKRTEATQHIESGEIDVPADLHLQPILNQDQEWQDRVPVCSASDYSGPKCNRILRDFLPADAVGAMPALNVDEEIDRTLQGRSGDYTCYLDQDWRFDEIEADARRRVGHEYGGRRHGSIGEIVVKGVHDVEAAFQKFHSNASCSAVADFWRSRQVQQHIADFCARLGESSTARTLAGNHLDAAEEAERARVHIYRQLAAFAHEALDGEVASPSAGTIQDPLLERTGSSKAYKTALGRRIDGFRKECGWSFDELANRTGFYKKLILGHVNEGRGARPNTLKMYADAFTKKLDRRVTVAELEG